MPIPSVRRVVLVFSLSVVAFGGSHIAVQGQTLSYSNRTLFNTAAPGLPSEGFEAGNVGSSQILAMPTGTLDKNTNNSFFSTGSILDGLRLSTRNSGGNAGGLLDIAGGATIFATGDNTKVIVVDTNSDTLDLNFDNGTTNAVGFDLVTNSNEGNNYTIQVFSGATLLRSDQIFPVSLVRFVGYSSSSVITRININAQNAETVDNIAFGTAASATPEPGNIAFLIGLTGSGLYASRRKWIRKSS